MNVVPASYGDSVWQLDHALDVLASDLILNAHCCQLLVILNSALSSHDSGFPVWVLAGICLNLFAQQHNIAIRVFEREIIFNKYAGRFVDFCLGLGFYLDSITWFEAPWCFKCSWRITQELRVFLQLMNSVLHIVVAGAQLFIYFGFKLRIGLVRAQLTTV